MAGMDNIPVRKPVYVLDLSDGRRLQATWCDVFVNPTTVFVAKLWELLLTNPELTPEILKEIGVEVLEG